jgi:hypothetical protein
MNNLNPAHHMTPARGGCMSVAIVDMILRSTSFALSRRLIDAP